MINVTIVYSDENMDSETDESLGLYFFGCAQELKKYIQSFVTYDIKLQEIHGRLLNPAYLEILLKKQQPQKFIFIAYSHGRENALLHEGIRYIEAERNTYLFKNALFYTNACLSGRILGQNLIQAGCTAFVGYNDEVVAANPYYDIFQACENYGIERFFQGENLDISYRKMKQKYTEKIEDLYEFDIFAASLLAKNRDALVLLGDNRLVIADFAY
ncbi:MAG: hypothetical protein JXI43_01580 [Tissierellales bacterium]|nr:hypothetical protein [Tissierellales bacterium]